MRSGRQAAELRSMAPHGQGLCTSKGHDGAWPCGAAEPTTGGGATEPTTGGGVRVAAVRPRSDECGANKPD